MYYELNAFLRSMNLQPSDPIPLWIKIAFTLWMAVWVWIILQSQGPQNFWWLCNVAKFLVLIGIWLNSRLLLSSQAGVIVMVGLFWTPDFVLALPMGGSLTGITAYMFDDQLSLIQRATSLYHIWLPLFVLWLCWRQGYDGRGVYLQWLIGTLAIVCGWWFGDPARNLNYTAAPLGLEQIWLPDWAWIPLLCVLTGLVLYLPGHWLLHWIARRRRPAVSTSNV